MRRCPVCRENKADDYFWNRQWKRLVPLDSRCWFVWRLKSMQRSFRAQANQSDLGRQLVAEEIQPWQLGTFAINKPFSKAKTRNERIEEMFRRANIRLPTNPTYVKTDVKL